MGKESNPGGLSFLNSQDLLLMNCYMKFIYFCSILLIYLQPSCFSQNWPKIFGTGYTDVFPDGGMFETYDKGYILIGQVQSGSYVPQPYCWIIKTDINGNKLWTKSISSHSYLIDIFGSDKTFDGGVILSGATN